MYHEHAQFANNQPEVRESAKCVGGKYVPYVMNYSRVVRSISGAIGCIATSGGMNSYVHAQATTNSEARTGQSVSVSPDRVKPRARPGWWNSAVFYQVFVRSFADSREGAGANDGIGDLRGLISRLDYLNDGNDNTTTDLGVTGLWLMPITQSPSYHGYDTTDYYTVESDYGSNDDFKALMVACHRRGINVIIDLVLNHCSNKHPWFEEARRDVTSPKRDWFIWNTANPGYRGPWNQSVWHRSGDSYFYGIFHGNMPDLNYANKDVSEEMLKVCGFWLTEMNADGFRLDAIRHLIEDGKLQDSTPATHDWLEVFSTYVRKAKPEVFTVGEVWAPTSIAAAYVNGQENSKLDTCFEFDLAGAIVQAARSGEAGKLASQLDVTWKSYPDNQFATFLANHDQTRVLTMLGGDESKARLAAGLLLTLPGVPFLYYGEEIGMAADKPDPNLRTPMQWTARASDDTQNQPNISSTSPLYAPFSVATPWKAANKDDDRVNVTLQSADTNSLLSYYRHAIALRRSVPALLRGGYVPVASTHPGVIAFVRTPPADGAVGSFTPSGALIIANLTGETIGSYSLTFTAGTEIGNMRLKRELTSGAAIHEGTLSSQGAYGPAAAIKQLSPRSVYVVEIAR